MPPAGELILQHPQNILDNPKYISYTDKPWARAYEPIRNLSVHSIVDEEGIPHATLDPAFLPLCEDEEEKRISEPAHPPNNRDVNISENVDSTYGVYTGNQRFPVAIGEMKRNLINDREWQSGRLGTAQQKLARELRG
ncbi:hypothetical protein OQA88_5504 [Cercophora sp. LCS_1]